ncbi:MAG: DUF4965 domain-containing protein, partial [Kiritimatiellae bacterium]|nr:DUF4965 domain-containing protein [Kiritimatiellia bacterium]
MKIRPPSVPLVTVDPYFSLWSPGDRLTDVDTTHWTGRANLLRGVALVNGKPFRFLGRGSDPALEQESLEVRALTTEAVFAGPGFRLRVSFTTPLLLEDLELMSRPVSFVEVRLEPVRGKAVPDVRIRLSASEQFCLDKEGDAPVRTRRVRLPQGLAGISIASENPRPLARSGDNLRIEWGRFVMAVASANAQTKTFAEKGVRFLQRTLEEHERANYRPGYARMELETAADLKFVSVEAPAAKKGEGLLFLLAYDDDGSSLEYFGRHLHSLWNRGGKTIERAIAEAAAGYAAERALCDAFDEKLAADATASGGEDYAALLSLAYRQSVAAHKLAVDENGDLIWVSKENFSNGSAATVDVSYPSIPLFLLYNPELVKAMMRPIYRFAASEKWPYDFAPHDCGTYPLVNGQTYGLDRETGVLRLEKQMPVEECGNMLVMEAAAALASGDASFASSHLDVLRGWVKYLEANGEDPGEQLCTDDFAGHLAHNCNLSLKAIMGIASFGIILGMLGMKREAAARMRQAKALAKGWMRRAKNPDGSFRLAFDRPGTFSLKYNAVWDNVFRLGIFPKGAFRGELARYEKEARPYGVPLDSRKTYTKSDWTVWAASLEGDKKAFRRMIGDLARFYDSTPDRSPMTDWYWADTAHQVGFQARSVQGGLWMKLLADKGLSV